MELADSSHPQKLTRDRRPPIPEPPPVRLVAVDDVVMIAPPGVEAELDAFYVGLLRFERVDVTLETRPPTEPILAGLVPQVPPARAERPLPPLRTGALQGPIYRAENFRLSFQIHEPLIQRDSLRAQGLEVPSLVAVALGLDHREIEYTRQRGLYPGHDSILVLDPGGNWLEISESRPVA